MNKIKIYCGLSIDAETVQSIIPTAMVCPPIKRCDLLKDIDEHYDIVGIIDGEFYNALATTPAEVIDALRCGIKVYGSSSIGALRAVECQEYGMIGVGEIFKHISNLDFFRDDFLAQGYSDASRQNEKIFKTTTYIDLYYILKSLKDAGIITVAEKEQIIEYFAGIYFPNRTESHLTSIILQKEKDPQQKERLLKIVSQCFSEKLFFSQKQNDAIVLLRRILEDITLVNNKNQQLMLIQKEQWDKSKRADLWK